MNEQWGCGPFFLFVWTIGITLVVLALMAKTGLRFDHVWQWLDSGVMP